MDLAPSHLLAQYGYLAVFVGCILEGESVLLLAGFAAHQGYLDIRLVIAVAFLSGTLGDQTYFLLGRRYGRSLLGRFPSLKVHAARVDLLVQRWRIGIIIMIRFLYGLRVAGPLIIGTGNTPVLTFALFNMLGAILWAVLVAGLGYVFGDAVTWFLDDMKRFEDAAIVVLIVLIAGLAAFRYRRSRLADARASQQSKRKAADTHPEEQA